jgi:S1-C subfamily serine protease
MIKFVVFFLLSLDLYANHLNIKLYSVTDNHNSYAIYENDILLTNTDKLKIELTSNKDSKVDIYYKFKDKIDQLGTIKLSKNEISTFPKDDFLNFDEEGEVALIFSENDKELTNFHITYIESKNIPLPIESNEKYGIDPEQIITNDRGIKEKQAYKSLVQSTVVVKTPNELGSGVVVSKKGEILTNYHVIKNQSTVNIAFKPKSEYATNPSQNSFLKAKVVKVDTLKDLALLQILDSQALNELNPIEFSKWGKLSTGDDVFMMGHPQGEYFTLGSGTISAIRQNYKWNDHKANFVIQTQSAASKGNSGGPLLGQDYKLIGINSFSNTAGQNLNFAVSIADINDFLSKKESQNFVIKIDNNYKNYTKLSFKSGNDKNNTPLTQFYLDSNNNGKVDLIAIDVGNNGIYNYLLFDSNEDGSFEKKAYDKDGDGVIERVVNY